MKKGNTYEHLYCIVRYQTYQNHLHRKQNRKDKRNIEKNRDKITVAEHSDKKIIIFYCVLGRKGKTCRIKDKNGSIFLFTRPISVVVGKDTYYFIHFCFSISSNDMVKNRVMNSTTHKYGYDV